MPPAAKGAATPPKTNGRNEYPAIPRNLFRVGVRMCSIRTSAQKGSAEGRGLFARRRRVLFFRAYPRSQYMLSPTVRTSLRMSSGKTCPMLPMRKVSAEVTFPG